MKKVREDTVIEDARIPLDCPHCGVRQRGISFEWVGNSDETERTSSKWRRLTCEDRYCRRPFGFRATMRPGYTIQIQRRWVPE
jgi:hypothetical protein